MIINKSGSHYPYMGTTYILGTHVTANEQTPYNGLLGKLLEIRDGPDKESEKQGPEFICKFLPPVNHNEIEQIENRFSALCQGNMALQDIDFDPVIMAAEEIEVITATVSNRKLTVYVLTEDWAIDGDYGIDQEPFLDYREAKITFLQKVHEELSNGQLKRWEDRDDLVVETDQDRYCSFLDGDYCVNHYMVTISTMEVYLSDALFDSIGRQYVDECRVRDLYSEMSGWEELEHFTDTDMDRMLSDPAIPKMLSNQINNADGETYYDILGRVGSEILRHFLEKEAKIRSCYQITEEGSYPFCAGVNENCTECCLCKADDA